MKRNLGIAAMNFFGLSAFFALLDLLVARFSIPAFVQMITRPAHLAFMIVFGLIVSIVPFFRNRQTAPAAAMA